MSQRCVVLYSGGLDSTVMLHECVKTYGKDNVFPLYLNYGSKHRTQEFTVAKATCNKLGLNLELITIDPEIFNNAALTGVDQKMPDNLEETIQVVVPFRNQCLITFAAMYADKIGTHIIYICPTKEDYAVFRDCRREFFDVLELSLRYGAKYDVEYVIETPYIFLTKEEVIKRGIELGVGFELTWSCYNPTVEGKPCNVCPACRVRSKGFEQAQVNDSLN